MAAKKCASAPISSVKSMIVMVLSSFSSAFSGGDVSDPKAGFTAERQRPRKRRTHRGGAAQAPARKRSALEVVPTGY
jgi:hypothetical protein